MHTATDGSIESCPAHKGEFRFGEKANFLFESKSQGQIWVCLGDKNQICEGHKLQNGQPHLFRTTTLWTVHSNQHTAKHQGSNVFGACCLSSIAGTVVVP